MKILGLDEHRTHRGSGILKFFELERVPDIEWVGIFQNLFTDEKEQAWVEGYCIVTNCRTSDITIRLQELQSKCSEANALLKRKQASLQ